MADFYLTRVVGEYLTCITDEGYLNMFTGKYGT